MTTDIFDFWSEIGSDEHIHPRDQAMFDRHPNHKFDVKEALPGAFMGPLRDPRAVFLAKNAGEWDFDMAGDRGKI
jgi:hypothetical protein